MRFAIKSRPEHQSWEELRDLWLAADELPLFESMLLATLAEWRDAGADLATIGLPAHFKPESLSDLATALGRFE